MMSGTLLDEILERIFKKGRQKRTKVCLPEISDYQYLKEKLHGKESCNKICISLIPWSVIDNRPLFHNNYSVSNIKSKA